MNIYNEGKNLTDKPIFIDFYADWWGPCKAFKQVLDKVTPDYTDKVNLYKVNVEEEIEIAGLFGARSLPTSVMISKEGGTQSVIGSLTEEVIRYYLDGLISK